MKTWDELEQLCSVPVDEHDIRPPDKDNGIFGKYIPAMLVISALNEVFGLPNWNAKITRRETYTDADFNITAICDVELIVVGLVGEERVYKSLPGAGCQTARSKKKYANDATMTIFPPIPGQREMVEKAALWDAVKNAAARLGNKFGMILYMDEEDIRNHLTQEQLDEINVKSYAKDAKVAEPEPSDEDGPVVPTKKQHREEKGVPDKLSCKDYVTIVGDEAVNFLQFLAFSSDKPNAKIAAWLKANGHTGKKSEKAEASEPLKQTVSPGVAATSIVKKLIDQMEPDDVVSPQVVKLLKEQLDRLDIKVPQHVNGLLGQLFSGDVKSLTQLKKASANVLTAYIFARAEGWDKDEFKARAAMMYETGLTMQETGASKDQAIAILKKMLADKITFRDARQSFIDAMPTTVETVVEVPQELVDIVTLAWPAGYDPKYLSELYSALKNGGIPIDPTHQVFAFLLEDYAKRIAK